MTLQIDFWQLLGFGGVLLSGFAAILVGAGRIIAAQFERRIEERFDALEEQRKREADGITALEREFLRWRGDLPLEYVRREDYVQAVATIMAKLDAMTLRFENILLRGEKRD